MTNEIAAMLLEMLALKGRIVTADAMHTQRATAEAVTARGGDYVLALKANQDSLHEDVRLYLDDPVRADELPSCQQVDGDHGRIETRRATVCHEVAWLQERHGWPGRLRQDRGNARDPPEDHNRNPLLHHERPALARTLPARRARPLGHRKLPPLGPRRHHERGPTAKPKGIG